MLRDIEFICEQNKFSVYWAEKRNRKEACESLALASAEISYETN